MKLQDTAVFIRINIPREWQAPAAASRPLTAASMPKA
jgi:hypothetical protein